MAKYFVYGMEKQKKNVERFEIRIIKLAHIDSQNLTTFIWFKGYSFSVEKKEKLKKKVSTNINSFIIICVSLI